MPDSTLANLTAATAATGGLFYGTQSSADRKFTFTAAGAALIEAADAAAQRTLLAIPETIQLACSDETTALTTGLKVTFRMPYGMTLTSVRASLTTAPTVSSVIVNVKESGATVLSSLLTLAIGSKTSTTTAISDSSLADDSEITIEVTQSGGVAAGLKLTLIGTRL
jgi:hypothetical protein